MTVCRERNSKSKNTLLYSGLVLSVVMAGAFIGGHHSSVQAQQQAAQGSTQNINQNSGAVDTLPPIADSVQAIDGQNMQLPGDFAQQQLPPSFSMEDVPEDTGASGQIIPASNNKDVNAAPSDVPAQPATKELVPSTPMGSAAQRTKTGNSVEDAAEADFQAQNSTPGPLEQYRQAQQQQESAQALPPEGDALPQVDNSTMVRLQGEFPNSAGNTSYGQIDGTIDPENDPVAKKALQDGIRRDAFDAAITGMFPLSPDQIKSLIGKYDETQRAVDAPPYAAPRPEINVTNVSLDPGVMPPTIKTAVGNVTTLNILDATGAPWPVQDVTWAGDFEIVEPEQGGHIIRITPMEQFARGNIVIRLLTLKTPLTMTLETSREIVQYRVDARVPEYGPFASAPLMQGGKSMVAGDSTLTSLLDGVPPAGTVKLRVEGVDGRTTAFSSGGQTYVRTPLTLLSPAWKSSVSSADGMNVYVLSSAPVLLLSDEGEFMRATLSEKEALLDE